MTSLESKAMKSKFVIKVLKVAKFYNVFIIHYIRNKFFKKKGDLL